MTEGYRKAALKLHAMSPADQRWMLQQLDEEERAQLTELLHELKELGIASTQDMTAEISADETVNKLLTAAPNRQVAERAFHAIQSAPASTMSAVLSSEPDSVTAAILGMYPWHWRSAFLADAGIEMRLRLGRLLGHSALKPRVAVELLTIVGRRVLELAMHHTDALPLYIEERQSIKNKVGMGTKRHTSLWERCRQWLR